MNNERVIQCRHVAAEELPTVADALLRSSLEIEGLPVRILVCPLCAGWLLAAFHGLETEVDLFGPEPNS